MLDTFVAVMRKTKWQSQYGYWNTHHCMVGIANNSSYRQYYVTSCFQDRTLGKRLAREKGHRNCRCLYGNLIDHFVVDNQLCLSTVKYCLQRWVYLAQKLMLYVHNSCHLLLCAIFRPVQLLAWFSIFINDFSVTTKAKRPKDHKMVSQSLRCGYRLRVEEIIQYNILGIM